MKKFFLISLLSVLLLNNFFNHTGQVGSAYTVNALTYTNDKEHNEITKSKKTYTSLYINEVMGEDNTLGADGYIEIYNDSSKRIRLKGYYLSNSVHDLKKWEFPDVKIRPYEILTVWTSKEDVRENQKVYTNFLVSPGNCPIILTAPDGITTIDSIDFKKTTGNKSFGRYPDGGPDLKYSRRPTPDSSNNNIYLANAPGKPGLAIAWDDGSVDAWHSLLDFEWFNNTRNTFCLAWPFRLDEEKWEKLRELKNRGNEIASHGVMDTTT